jgi:hypothetical protein
MPTFSPYHNAVVVLGRAKPDASDRFSSRDPSSAGLIDTVIYLPTVDDQATLDAAAAAALAKIQASRSSSTDAINSDQMMENITLEVIDKNPTGTFNPEDTVIVISATLGLAGLYKVKRIERDMTDPNYAKLDMTTRHTEYWQLDEDMRRTVRNLNTLV